MAKLLVNNEFINRNQLHNFIILTPLGWMIEWWVDDRCIGVDTYAYKYWEDAHDHLIGKGHRY